jgi:hypothetical protein
MGREREKTKRIKRIGYMKRVRSLGRYTRVEERKDKG